MKNAKKILVSSLLAVLFFVFITSCSNSDGSMTDTAGTSKLVVKLTDSPGFYDEVNIEVLDVKIKNSLELDEEDKPEHDSPAPNNDNPDNEMSDHESGWVSVGNVTPGIYNLLDLTGGVTTVLSNSDIPSGYVGQVRLILGTHNTVVKDGITYPLKTPSAQHSGLKLKLDETLNPNFTYTYIIDFDVNKSIVQAGNSGIYILKPCLRLISQATTGAIQGKAFISGFQVSASVVVDGETVTALTNSEGIFYLHGIPAGTYTVTITPDPLSGHSPITIDNVVVVNGIVTNMGTIAI